MTTVAFILVSWRPDAPAGMERAVVASAVGLAMAGHNAVIVTGNRAAPDSYRSVPITILDTLTVPDPCGDTELRSAVGTAENRVQHEMLRILAAHAADAAVYVDALWGLGRIMPAGGNARRVLAVHVVGDRIDMTA